MKPEAYILNVHQHLVESSIIAHYRFTRQRVTDSDVLFQAHISLIDGSYLRVSEYAEGDDTGHIQVVMYTYHWMDAEKNLIMRWDNAEHYPSIPNFPHHIHDGDEKNVIPGEPMNLFYVLEIISDLLDH